MLPEKEQAPQTLIHESSNKNTYFEIIKVGKDNAENTTSKSHWKNTSSLDLKLHYPIHLLKFIETSLVQLELMRLNIENWHFSVFEYFPTQELESLLIWFEN